MKSFKHVSVRQAVTLAAENMGLESQLNKLVPLFTLWATEAERRIGSYTQYDEDIVVLDVQDCYSEPLPCSAVAVLGVIAGDKGCDCTLLFRNAFSNYSSQSIAPNAQYGFYVLDGGSMQCTPNLQWRITDGRIHFINGTYRAGKITVKILRQQEEDGFIKIVEHHKYAIAEFIRWMWMKRNRTDPKGKLYYQGEIAAAQQEWSRLCANATATDGEPTPDQINYIRALYNDPTSGLAYASWIYQDPYYYANRIVF